MRAMIAVLPGDGIGPEVTEQAVRVLEKVARMGDHRFDFVIGDIGAFALEWRGTALPEETLDLCRTADAVLLGAVGGLPISAGGPRPEEGLLRLRREMGLFANLRPVRVVPELTGGSPVKASRLEGVDILFVRELTGGIYFGRKHRDADHAVDECAYSRDEIRRVVRVACEAARQRGRLGKITSIDKANVLETSRLWRETVDALVAEEYPDLGLEHMLVDAAAMKLISEPTAFDVIVTENLFGDILTDAASVLTGALGNLPSASLGERGPGLFEPVHGSAPDIAGEGVANPFGAILSAAMLLRHSLGLEDEARAVERAVEDAIRAGVLTADLAGRGAAAATEIVGATVTGQLGVVVRR